MFLAEDWGAERNQWLVDLSFTIAVSASTILAVSLLVLFRVPLFKLLTPLARPILKPILAGMRIVLALTPLRHPLRRYLYQGRHLVTQEA